MNKKLWKVNELDTSTIATITMSYTDDDGNSHSLSYDADAIGYALRTYFDYCFIDYTGSVKADVLKVNFSKWWALNSDRFSRLYRALDEKYNPIENYAKKGHIETRHGHIISTDIDGGIHKITTVPNEIKTESFERASDSLELTKTMETKTSATANVGGTSTSDAYHDENKVTNSGTDIVEDTTHGNIGTMLSATAVLEEFKVRTFSLIDRITGDFMLENAFYIDDTICW